MRSVRWVTRALVEPLIAALKDKERMVRTSAAEALGKRGDARAVEPLIALLGDENAEVREKAVIALGKVAAARAMKPIIAMLVDKEYIVSRAAAQTLVALGDPAIEPLIADARG